MVTTPLHNLVVFQLLRVDVIRRNDEAIRTINKQFLFHVADCFVPANEEHCLASYNFIHALMCC